MPFPLPEELRGDELRLKQILINLTKNAMKFTRHENSKIVIFVAFDHQDEMLRVCVSDNGKGIEKCEQKLIFEKFGKLLRTAEMNSEGIGLGLNISKKLVKANGGELKVASRGVNKGAQFMFAMKMQQMR